MLAFLQVTPRRLANAAHFIGHTLENTRFLRCYTTAIEQALNNDSKKKRFARKKNDGPRKLRGPPESAKTLNLGSPKEGEAFPAISDDGFMHGYFGLIGRPNAGKSSILNRLVGEKVSVVTRKAQTTRFAVSGVKTILENKRQLVFLDTPGIGSPDVPASLTHAASKATRVCDVLCLIADATRPIEYQKPLLPYLSAEGIPVWLVLNKVDMVRDKRRLLLLVEDLAADIRTTANKDVGEVFFTSAKDNAGIADFAKRMEEHCTREGLAYPIHMTAAIPDLIRVEECIREKIYRSVHNEVPYRVRQRTEGWTEFRDGSLRIDHELIAPTIGAKKMLIGSGGATLKWIGSEARQELTLMLGRKVHLFLHVRVGDGLDRDIALNDLPSTL